MFSFSIEYIFYIFIEYFFSSFIEVELLDVNSLSLEEII